MIRSSITVAFCIAMLGGCTGISPSNLRKPASPASLVLAKDITWSWKSSGIEGTIYTDYKLDAGLYRVEYEDDKGRYFRGPGRCYLITIVRVEGFQPQNPDMTLNQEKDLPCGIYVPFKPNDDMRFYIFVNQKSQPREKPSDSATPDAPKTAIVAVVVPAGASLASAGVGAVVGAAVVTGMIAAETGNVLISSRQPPPGAIRGASSISEIRSNEWTASPE